MIIAGYIFSVAWLSLRQSSLILVDAWHSPKMTDLVKRIIDEKFGYEQTTLMLITTEELDTRTNTRSLKKESNFYIFTSKRIFLILFFKCFKRKAD
jgi:hypothetical protein